ARVVPLNGDLQPGMHGFIQIVLERPIAAVVGDRFVLRDTSSTRCLGGGRFVDLRAPARKRGTSERLATLAAASHLDMTKALSALLRLAPVELTAFLRDRGRDGSDQARVCREVGADIIDTLALMPEHLEALHSG